jgi:high-affinity K+ transport system ATPase subunit B
LDVTVLEIWLICFFVVWFALFKQRRSTGEGKASILLLRGKREEGKSKQVES